MGLLSRVTLLLIFTAAAHCEESLASDQSRPNFVWLMSEDNSIHYWDHYDPHGAPMPNMRRLAEHGLTFNHCFSNGAVCSVARTTLISSCYAPRIGAHHHRRARPAPMPAGLSMFPAYLRRAGYYTANNEKEDFNITPGSQGPWNHCSGTADWRNRAEGQPFFYVKTLSTTHESKLHFKDMRETLNTNPSTVSLPPIYPDTELFRYTAARYRDLHVRLDRQFGKVIEDLRQEGVMDDTFVFYFGDHGGVLPGSKGYVYERGMHVPLVIYVPTNFAHLLDESMREHGKRIDGVVEFVDFGPTVLSLAGVKLPNGIDGKPFLGKGITREIMQQRDEALGHADRFDEKYDMVRSLRVGKFKYIRSYQPFNIDALYNRYRYQMLAYQQWSEMHRAGELTTVQSAFFEPRPSEMLFDVEVDPYETNNLAQNPSFTETLLGIRARLTERMKGMPDLGFIPEPIFLKEAIRGPVQYGQAERTRISRLVDIANLQLLPYSEARGSLSEALESDDRIELYWALITASTFGADARELAPLVKTIASNSSKDSLLLARIAEFAAMTGANMQFDNRRLIADALTHSSSMTESLLVLNTAALLHTTSHGFDRVLAVPKPHQSHEWVQNRLHFLSRSSRF